MARVFSIGDDFTPAEVDRAREDIGRLVEALKRLEAVAAETERPPARQSGPTA
jgi:hypothetical protein